jgi:endonuclease/exonuclease/phosphatase family metal-dependent hydrolase
MKIATFNVEFLFAEGEHKHSGKTWFYSPDYVVSRVDHLSKMIADIDADFLFLQEVASASMIEKIIKKTGKNYLYFLATPDNRSVGNAVIYKPTDCKIESIPAVTDFPVMVEGDADSIGPKLHSRRGYVHLTTTYNGKPLHLFGLHLNSRFFIHLQSKKDRTPLPTNTQMEAADGLIRSEIFRSIQARKMRQVIDELIAHDKDVQIAVMGDFNSIERDTPLRIIQGEFESHDDALASPARRIPIENRYSFIGEQGPKLIDYILITKNLESFVKSFKILNEGLSHHSNKAPTPTFIESDHAPIVMEI